MDPDSELERGRTCLPELLDTLPHDHPEALHSRRDLRLVNRFMGNPGWFGRTLPRLVRPGERILELGAGTGELSRKLHQLRLAADGLDLCPEPAPWPRERSWHQEDLKTFEGYRDYPVVIGNLIFHQFTDGELADLGAHLSACARVVVASEPTRRRLSQRMMRAVAPLFGANRVTLHDAHVSIAAGFLGDELPRALGLLPEHWDTTCTTTVTGAYRMVAVRRDRG